MSKTITICGWCRASGDQEKGVVLRFCSECKNAAYCSAACQKKHWKEHKPACVERRGRKLIRAIAEGDLAKVKRIVKKSRWAVNARVDYITKDYQFCFRWTALHECVYCENLDIFKFLLENGADIQMTDFYGASVLAEATREGSLQMIEILIENGADVNHRGFKGNVPLMVAVERNHLSAVQALLSAGADPNMLDVDGWSPILLAASKGFDDIVSALLDAGADHKLGHDFDGRSALENVEVRISTNYLTVLKGETDQEGMARYGRTRALLVLAQSNAYRKSEVALQKGRKESV
jgi:ankyrin repeat protein